MAAQNKEYDHQILPENGLKAVFVETTFDTRFAVAIPLSSTVRDLQKQIGLEHFNFFPSLGRIMIESVAVKVDEIYYNLPETMLLKTAFHGLKTWVVFALVWTPKGCSKKQILNEVAPPTLPIPSDQDVNNQPPSQLHETPDTSCKVKKKRIRKSKTVKKKNAVDQTDAKKIRKSKTMKKKNAVDQTDAKKIRKSKTMKKKNAVDQTDAVINLPSTIINKPKKNVETGSQDSKIVQQKNYPASSVVTRPCVVHQYTSLQVKGDAPSVNGNTIQGCEQNIYVASAEVLSQNVSLMKPGNNSKKRRTCDGERESQDAVQNVSSSHMSNVSELLTEGVSLNIVEKEKEIEEAVAPLKLENSAKKRKTNQILSSSTTQDLSSSRPNDNETIDGAKPINGELSLPDDGRPDESVGGLHSQNMKAVSGKDPHGSFEKQQLDEEIKEMASPIITLQSDKPKKKNQRKKPVPAENLSSELQNQHSNEVEMCTPKNVDDSLTMADANDALLKSENTAAILETHGNDLDVSKVVLSQEKPLNLIEKEKEIKENFASSKSEAKKRKTMKAKSSGKETQDSSSRRLNQDESDGTRHIHAEVSVANDIDRPEGSVETMDGKQKISQNGKVVPLQKQLDKESSGKSRKRTQTKQPAFEKDNSSLPLDQQLDEKTVKLDVSKKVERADDLLRNHDIGGSENQKEVMQGEGLQGEMSEIPPLEDPFGSRASWQRPKKLDQLPSVDTSSNGLSLVDSKKNRGSAKTSELQKSVSKQRDLAGVSHASVEDGSTKTELQNSITDQNHNKSTPSLSAKHSTVSKKVQDTLVSPAVLGITLGKTGVSCASSDETSHSSDLSGMSGGSTVQKIREGKKAKQPLNKLAEDGNGLSHSSRLTSRGITNTSKQKKGGSASSRAIFDDGNNSSSDDEDRTYASSSSTSLPPDDDSEDESKGVVRSKHDSSKRNGISKANSSPLKLESLLRSSSRYKKAKLVASQLQSESEPPEFVPDSQVDMAQPVSEDVRDEVPTTMDTTKVEHEAEEQQIIEHKMKQVDGDVAASNTNKEMSPSKPKRRKSVAVTRRSKAQQSALTKKQVTPVKKMEEGQI